MLIHVTRTPNPNTQRLHPGHPIWEGQPQEFSTPAKSDASPLAKDLLSIPGISRVMIAYDFVSISKTTQADWDTLMPQVLVISQPFFEQGQQVIDASKLPVMPHILKTPIEQTIKDMIDSRIRPAVAQDGGDMDLTGFQDGVVYVKMKGACVDCPSVAMTLKMGTERLLRQYIPSILRVESVN